MPEKACKTCKRILESSDVCPTCKTSELTPHWRGYAIIVDPEHSEIAKEINAQSRGKYALRLSR